MKGSASSLSSRLAERRLLVAVGVFDALSALVAQRQGFEAVFLSGSALAYTQLGRPDVGLLTATEVADAVSRVRDAVDIPVLVDADHGFGNAINVYRTMRMLERSGAHGIQIEDRREAVPPADLRRTPLLSAEVMADKIRAAVDARVSSETVVSARTDALPGRGVDEALERADRYIDAGADMVFVEGCATDEARSEIASRLASRIPLLFNAGILDISTVPEPAEFEQLGYAMILFPRHALAAAAGAMQSALADLQSWAGGDAAAKSADLDTVIGSDDFMTRFL